VLQFIHILWHSVSLKQESTVKTAHVCVHIIVYNCHIQYHTTTILRPFLRDHPGEPVTEENFGTLWCKGRLTEADTTSRRHCIQTNQCPPPPCPHFFTGQRPFLPPNQQCQSTEGN